MTNENLFVFSSCSFFLLLFPPHLGRLQVLFAAPHITYKSKYLWWASRFVGNDGIHRFSPNKLMNASPRAYADNTKLTCSRTLFPSSSPSAPSAVSLIVFEQMSILVCMYFNTYTYIYTWSSCACIFCRQYNDRTRTRKEGNIDGSTIV